MTTAAAWCRLTMIEDLVWELSGCCQWAAPQRLV
jgi:hypothetical protein